MPNIQGYSAPSGLSLNPTETGIEAVTGSARRLGAYGNQIADTKTQEGHEAQTSTVDTLTVANDYMTHRDLQAGAPHGTALAANLDNAWNQLLKGGAPGPDGKPLPPADINDPSLRQKFLEEQVEPALQDFQKGFNTEKSQEWAEQFSNNLRTHLSNKSGADIASLAGEAAVQTVIKTTNNLSSMVANDPSSLDFALAQYKHAVGAAVDNNPMLDATKAAAVKGDLKGEEKIVKAAISGMITKNPNVNLDAIQKKYGDYIDGAEMKTFQHQAQVEAKKDALVDKQNQVAQRQLDELNVHKAATQTLTDNVTFDPQTGKPIVDPKFFSQALDIARKNPNAPNAAATVQTMFNWGESQQSKGAKPEDDPATKTDLTDRMFLADKPTTTLDLMKARAEGKLSDHSFQALHGLVTELEQAPLKGPIWTDTIGAVKGQLILSGVGLPGKDVPGESNYAKWAQTFIPQYLAKSRAGTLEPNALDVKDPNSMISKSMQPFARTIQQRAQDYLATMSRGDPGAPRNDTMPAIPPAAERAAGSIYETPKGKMKWTGTGWVQP